MFKIKVEKCLNGRIHIWFGKIKIFSWGPKSVKPYKNPKLGVSYSVWDGEELLEQSIKQIRPVVNYVNVVWQKLSWYGKPCNPGLEKLLLKLKDKGLIDEIIFFEPDLSLNPNYNEINKRNVGLCAARRAGCTHFMTMDTDEFYDTEQFRLSYNDIINRNLDNTVCGIVSYVTPTIRYRDYDSYYVSFISRIDRGEKFSFGKGINGIPCVIDPTRKFQIRKNARFCILGDIVMHHMRHVRKDIKKKVLNSSLNQSKESNSNLMKEYLNIDVKSGLKSGIFIETNNNFKIKI